MIPNINPRKMQQMMRQMGIQQVDIPATEVIIKTRDKLLVITNPSVQKVNMMGQETFQISGEIEERSSSTTPEISEEDVQTVIDQTGADRNTAQNALQKAQGDLAQAIIDLKEE
ncbi:MAG: nascent polypeptide-associated complex protein [Nanoarchaeota archaeon]